MTDFSITNQSEVEIKGTAGEDRLSFTYNTTTNDVWLKGLSPVPVGAQTPVSGGYAGYFNGMGYNDAWFTGIEHFTFTDESGGNDDIRTGDGNDVLNGGAGNDNLEGWGGINRIDGGDGNDRAQLKMAWASEALTIDLNTSSSFLGTGLLTNVESVDLTTGSGNDSVTGHQSSSMHDAVQTGDGDDIVTLWMGGSDTVYGGAGNDLLALTYAVPTDGVWLIDTAADTVNGGYKGQFNGMGSNDVWFTGIERFSFTDLSSGNDDIRTGDGADTLNGGGGNDKLVGNGGADSIDGGLGNDRWGGNFASSSAAFKIDLNGTSTFLTSGSVKNIEAMDLVTGAGNDTITGHKTSSMADSVKTGAGNDSIRLWMGGSDTVDGGAGSDVLALTYAVPTDGVWLTNTAADTVDGGYKGQFNGMGSNDVWFTGIERFSFTDASGGHDIIRTGDGADTLNGGGGNDSLDGGGGADVLNGGAGVDTLVGGAGNDTYVVNLTAAGTLEDVITETSTLATEIDTLKLAGTSTNATAATISLASGLANIERLDLSAAGTSKLNLTGNANANVLTGNGAANVIRGGSGNDTVSGGSGNDKLYGDAGADSLVGGSGADSLVGGTGIDKLVGGTGNDLYVVNLTAAGKLEDTIVETSTVSTEIDTLKLAGGSTNTTAVTISLSTSGLVNIERLDASATGTSKLNLTGNTKANLLTGNGAANVIRGGSGNDTVSGGSGNDTLYGDAGNDSLVGGSGNDKLIGGAGKDVLTGGAGNDVFDFNALSEMGGTISTRDIIKDFARGYDRIDLSTLDANASTTTNDAFSSKLVSSFTAAGQLKFASGVLYGNTDADATAEFAIELTGVTSLSATDLIL